ncbi:MAG: cellulase family glycosylhydrolase [Myxococcales bacterium]
MRPTPVSSRGRLASAAAFLGALLACSGGASGTSGSGGSSGGSTAGATGGASSGTTGGGSTGAGSTTVGSSSSSGGSSTGAGPSCADPLVLPLTGAGGQLVDARGCATRLRGIDLEMSLLQDPPAVAAARIAADGFNFVRVAIFWSSFESQAPSVTDAGVVHHWNANALGAFGALCGALADAGVPVIPDMHQDAFGIPNWVFGCPGPVVLDPDAGLNCWANAARKCDFFENADAGGALAPYDALTAAWLELLATARAQGAQVVGMDILNEPEALTSCPGYLEGGLDGFFASIAGRIEATQSDAGPAALFMIEDGAYDAYCHLGHQFSLTDALPQALADAGVPAGGWAYSWHFYPYGWADGEPSLLDHWNRARQWGVPFWLGEFNPRFGSMDGGCGPAAQFNPGWRADPMSDELGDPEGGRQGFFDDAGFSYSLWVYQATGQGGLIWDTGDPGDDLLHALQWALDAG